MNIVRERVTELFIDPLRRILIMPRGRDAAEFLGEIEAALAEYSPRALEEAAQWFRDHWTKQAFPSPADCRRVAAGMGRGPDPEGFARKGGWQSETEALAERQAAEWRAKVAAARLAGEPMALEARDSRWLVGLLQWVVDHGALPDPGQAWRIAQAAQAIDARLAAESNLPFTAQLVAWREAMHSRAQREVFGPPPAAAMAPHDPQLPLFDEAARAAAEKRLAELQGAPMPALSPELRRRYGLIEELVNDKAADLGP